MRKPIDTKGSFYDEDLGMEVPEEEYYNDPDNVDVEERIEIVTKDLWGEFEPTWYQYEWYKHFTQRDENGKLLKNIEGCAVVHRRAGKSTGVFKTFFLPWMLEERNHYVHAFPTLAQGKKAIWQGQGKITRDPNKQAVPYLELIPTDLWFKKNNQEMTLELLNGSIYQLVGVRGFDGTADHLLGLNCAGVVCDEAKDWRDGIVGEIFEPMLGQNGGPLFRIGTAGDENEFYRRYNYCKMKQEQGDHTKKAWSLTVDDTYYNDGQRVISEKYIQEQIEKGVEPETIQAHYFCKFGVASSGAYYKHQIDKAIEEKRITKVPYDPNYPVYRFWDLGVSGKSATATNACWDAQFPNEREVWLINFDQDPEKALWEMMTELKKNREYVVKANFFPWDANSPESTGMTKVEYCRSQGVVDDIHVIKRSASKQEGIDFTKAQFHKFYFDEVNCAYGITCLKGYVKKKNLSTDTFGDAEKNDFIHGADALRTLGTALARNEVPIGKHSFYNPEQIEEMSTAICDDLEI